MMGFSIIIPKQVLEEVKDLSRTKTEAEIALKILEKNEFKKVTLHGRNVDNGIIEMANENKEWVIATLDREIQSKVKNQKLIIRGERKIEIL
jgi:rRNA-processing protein FCF1